MEKEYGGPVWHGSVASRSLKDWEWFEEKAQTLLGGVGEATRGEWREYSDQPGMRVLHVKRRLNSGEEVVAGILRDIRGTTEMVRRAEAVSRATGFSRDFLLSTG